MIVLLSFFTHITRSLADRLLQAGKTSDQLVCFLNTQPLLYGLLHGGDQLHVAIKDRTDNLAVMTDQSTITTVFQDFEKSRTGIGRLNLADAEEVNIEHLDTIGHWYAGKFHSAADCVGPSNQPLGIAGRPDSVNPPLVFCDVTCSKDMLVGCEQPVVDNHPVLDLEAAISCQVTVRSHTGGEDDNVSRDFAAVFKQYAVHGFVTGELLDLDATFYRHMLIVEIGLEQFCRLGRELSRQQPVETLENGDLCSAFLQSPCGFQSEQSSTDTDRPAPRSQSIDQFFGMFECPQHGHSVTIGTGNWRDEGVCTIA